MLCSDNVGIGFDGFVNFTLCSQDNNDEILRHSSRSWLHKILSRLQHPKNQNGYNGWTPKSTRNEGKQKRAHQCHSQFHCKYWYLK